MQVELSPRTIKDDGCSIIGSCCVLCGGESSKPLTGSFSWLTDLRYPFSPASLPDSSVSKFTVVWSSFAFALPATATAAVVTVCVTCCGGSGGGCGGDVIGAFVIGWYCDGGGGGFLGRMRER